MHRTAYTMSSSSRPPAPPGQIFFGSYSFSGTTKSGSSYFGKIRGSARSPLIGGDARVHKRSSKAKKHSRKKLEDLTAELDREFKTTTHPLSTLVPPKSAPALACASSVRSVFPETFALCPESMLLSCGHVSHHMQHPMISSPVILTSSHRRAFRLRLLSIHEYPGSPTKLNIYFISPAPLLDENNRVIT